MKQRSLYSAIFFIGTAITFFSCSKETDISSNTFYGKWKTSYGDTISFSRINGENIIRYNNSMNPLMPMTSSYEYTYINNKLGIKDGFSSAGTYRFYQSFRWLEEGRSFEIQGVEWFLFMSSTTTYFTFTKIP